MNVNKLRAKLFEHGISPEEMAQKLKISKTAFYRKLRGVTEFKQSEIMGIITFLDLNYQDIHEIFFAQKVS